MEVLHTIGEAIWFIFPAYVANATPVVLGGGPPIDFNKKLPDGNRILGDGKTILGFITGLLGGSIFGILQHLAYGRLGGWGIAILLSLGALIGDMVGSFLKRRRGLARGSPMPGLDQLEFIVGAVLVGSLIVVPRWEMLVVLLVFTPLIHLGTNLVGYKLGFKSEPY